MTQGQKERELDKLYARLPAIACQGKCWTECTTVPCSVAERERAAKTKGHVPLPTASGLCPYLENRRCSIHKVRPMLCRLWGVTEQLPCPHGCKPERYLTPAEERAFYQKAMEIGRA